MSRMNSFFHKKVTSIRLCSTLVINGVSTQVSKLGGLPGGISDVWEALGKPEDCRYTWDMETNDNKDIPKTIRMRWDRIFTRASIDGAAVVPKNMALIGQERLNCGLFASDHWGVLCDFTVKPQDTPHESTW